MASFNVDQTENIQAHITSFKVIPYLVNSKLHRIERILYLNYCNLSKTYFVWPVLMLSGYLIS